MDAPFVIRIIGVLIAAVGMGAVVANLRRRSMSPTYAWAILGLALIIGGIVVALAAVSIGR